MNVFWQMALCAYFKFSVSSMLVCLASVYAFCCVFRLIVLFFLISSLSISFYLFFA